MANTIVYMDGGSARHHQSKECLLSWGMVALTGDQSIERYGCHARVEPKHSGYHEKVAFVESVRFLRESGHKPFELTFYTDDSAVCDVNRSYVLADKLPQSNTISRLKDVCATFYRGEKDLMYHCLNYLKNSRFVKVKGHDKTVYNLRCDALAVHARNWAIGNLSPLLSFEEWLHDGFTFYAPDRERPGENKLNYWYAPFSGLHGLA